MQQDVYYPVHSKTLADTINYLGSRPYREVAHIINDLAKSVEAENAKAKNTGVHQEQRADHNKSDKAPASVVSECPA